jgi:hypothetical protein
LAQTGHTETICCLSAFGVKRTCIGLCLRGPRSLMTQSGHGNAHPLSLVPSISLSGEMPPMT